MKTSSIRHALAGLVIVLAATPALAQNSAGSMLQKSAQQLHTKFLAADKDKDGFLTRDEAEAGKMPSVAKHFDAIDSAHAGKISEKEIRQWYAQKASERYSKPPAASTSSGK